MWMRIYVIVWFGDYGYFNLFLLINWRIKKKINDLLKCYKFYINWKMLMYSLILLFDDIYIENYWNEMI